MILRIFFIALTLFIAASCRSGEGVRDSESLPGGGEMADMNKYLIQKDRERIENFIERRGLDMKETPSGLWFSIEDEGTGEYFTDNDLIRIEYDCSLIDGTRCYSSQQQGPKDVVLGRSEMEPGLNEALRMLKPGGKGIFILQPFLAFGLKGDGKNIPPRQVIVYNIYLTSLVPIPGQ
jgi:FKBP-type peptidyl-prolyl cis-trans isomerase FkpA